MRCHQSASLRTDNPGRYQELKLKAADTILRFTQPPPVGEFVAPLLAVRWLAAPPSLSPVDKIPQLIELQAGEPDDDAPPPS